MQEPNTTEVSPYHSSAQPCARAERGFVGQIYRTSMLHWLIFESGTGKREELGEVWLVENEQWRNFSINDVNNSKKAVMEL